MKRKLDVQESLVTDFRMFLQTETGVTVSLQRVRNINFYGKSRCDDN